MPPPPLLAALVGGAADAGCDVGLAAVDAAWSTLGFAAFGGSLAPASAPEPFGGSFVPAAASEAGASPGLAWDLSSAAGFASDDDGEALAPSVFAGAAEAGPDAPAAGVCVAGGLGSLDDTSVALRSISADGFLASVSGVGLFGPLLGPGFLLIAAKASRNPAGTPQSTHDNLGDRATSLSQSAGYFRSVILGNSDAACAVRASTSLRLGSRAISTLRMPSSASRAAAASEIQ